MKNLFRTVALSHCHDYQRDNVEKSVMDTLDHLCGSGLFISQGDRVLIKPNLLKGSLPGECITTHPAVVEAMVRIVLDHGGRPFIGDSPAFGELSAVAKATGMADVCKRYNIPLQPFNSPVAVKVSDPFVRTLLSTLCITGVDTHTLQPYKNNRKRVETLQDKGRFKNAEAVGWAPPTLRRVFHYLFQYPFHKRPYLCQSLLTVSFITQYQDRLGI